jgi:multidrug efflux pump
MFWVTMMSLMISWIVAVIFTPYLGYKLLPDFAKRRDAKGGHAHHDVYDTRFYRAFGRLVAGCVRWRKTVIALTIAAFVISLWAFKFVPQQFFPGSTRPELFVELRLPEGSSFKAMRAEVERFEARIAKDPEILNYASYIGGSSPRFFLPMLPEFNQANYAQFVLMTVGDAGRDRVKKRLEDLIVEEFPNVRGRVAGLENGPPVGWPVQFRVSGPDPEILRGYARQVREVMAADPGTADPFLDWSEKSRVVRLEIDQDKARALGVDSRDLSTTLAGLLTGTTVTEYREGRELIPVVARAVSEERLSLGALDNVFVPAAGGRSVPLAQVARVVDGFEDGVLWRRNRLTTITVKSDVVAGVQAPDVSMRIDAALAKVRATMPAGYRIKMGGAIEESSKGQGSIAAVTPWMLVTMLTILMLMLQSFQRTVMVFLSAPFGLIGVTFALLIFDQAFGFVALLGVIALAGMIMRNSVILVDQIEQDVRSGHTQFEAVVGATVRRSRPIALTAAAAVLAMIPLTREAFFAPMAVAIMGGLVVATVLTLVSLPALYALWFRVKVPDAASSAGRPAALPAGAMAE